MDLDDILRIAVERGASDIHLKAGIVPVVRKHGALRPLSSQVRRLSSEDIEAMASSIMDEGQRKEFEEQKEIDIGYGVTGLGRFRINIFKQRGTTRIVIRHIPHSVPTFENLNLPSVLKTIANFERGLVLVTGITGSGKSSTLAAMIQYINDHKNKHILTIEDPIEFLIKDHKSIVTQRELGVDASSFSKALRAGLRQDPDVILIGEMRDRDTIETALLAAETGHLVLSTLHTMDAAESVNRIIAAFEPHHQGQIRLQIASVLRAAISQRLARRKDGGGFIPAVEVMINNARIKKLIEDPFRTTEILQAIEESKIPAGMRSFDQSLMDLVGKGVITFEEALNQCTNPEDFRIRYDGITPGDDQKWGKSNALDKRIAQAWQNLGELELEPTRRAKPEDKEDSDRRRRRRKKA